MRAAQSTDRYQTPYRRQKKSSPGPRYEQRITLWFEGSNDHPGWPKALAPKRATGPEALAANL